jgi:hypothetical protein
MKVEQKQPAAPPTRIDVEKNDSVAREPKSRRIQTKTGEGADEFDEAFLVAFTPGDSENPLNWSNKLKWGITAAVSSTGFVRIMVSTVRSGAHARTDANETCGR